MKKETRTHSWKLADGRTATVTCTLEYGEKAEAAYVDGWNVPVTKKVCKITTTADVQGLGKVGTWLSRTSGVANGINYAAKCGKLAITDENLNAIDAMLDDLKSHPAYVAKVAAEKKSDEEYAEYERSTAQINRAMNM